MQGGADPAFFAIVVELVRVEVTLLLRDALSPDSFIPATWPTAGVSPHRQTHAAAEPASSSAGQPAEEGRTAAAEAVTAQEGLESGATPLEEHVMGKSPLARMAQDTKRIDGMDVPPTATASGELKQSAGSHPGPSGKDASDDKYPGQLYWRVHQGKVPLRSMAASWYTFDCASQACGCGYRTACMLESIIPTVRLPDMIM